MTLLPNLKDANTRFSLEIDFFQTICAAQGVHCGHPDDLFAFPFQLSHEPELLQTVMDFVARLHRLAALDSPFLDILSILLLAIGGPTVPTQEADLYSSASLITGFLLPLDLWSEADLREATELEDRIRIELSREDRQPVEVGPQLLETPTSPAAIADHPLPSKQELSAVIERLERSNRELREQLLEMDHRVRLIEPQAPPAAAPYHLAPNLRAPWQPPAPATPSTSVAHLPHPIESPPYNLDPSPKPSVRLTEEEHLADQRRIEAPLRRRRLVRIAAILVVSLSAAAAVVYTSLRPSPEKATIVEPVSPSSAMRLPNATSSMVPPSDTTSSELAPSHLTIYSADAQPAPARRRSSTKPSAALSGPAPSASRRSTAAGSIHPVNVSSSVMAERLVSSMPPAYPRLAALTHLHGVVVVRATIAKDGTVERVHALGGHYLLRNAATNAVKSWRYKPYYLNGEPVEVATLVTIDFAPTP